MRMLPILPSVLTAVGCNSPSTDDWIELLKDPDVVKRRQASDGESASANDGAGLPKLCES
jgi:hypothetical protein